MKNCDFNVALEFIQEKINESLAKEAIHEGPISELMKGYLHLVTAVLYIQLLETITANNEVYRHAINCLTETESEDAFKCVVEICSLQKDFAVDFKDKMDEIVKRS